MATIAPICKPAPPARIAANADFDELGDPEITKRTQ